MIFWVARTAASLGILAVTAGVAYGWAQGNPEDAQVVKRVGEHAAPMLKTGVHEVVSMARGCERTNKVVVVKLDKYPMILRHVRYAVRYPGEDGYVEVRVLTLERNHADRRRRAALKRFPTKPGYDRDEYPPAVSEEGGLGSDVRYVRSGENRAAGASMGNQLEDYCDGQRFRIALRPRP